MSSRKKYILTSLLCDTLAAAAVLSLFCWFHHVKRMTEADDGGDGGIIIGGVQGDGSVGGRDDTDAADDDTSDGTSEDTGEETDKTTDTEASDETEPTEPVYDTSGDFAATLPEVFLPEGEIEEGDGYYRSHDINLTVTEYVEDFGDYYARYIVYDVYVRNLENIFTVSSTKRKPFTELVQAAGDPIAAISGDFWGNVACVTVRNGEVLNADKSLDRDICAMYADGSMEIISKDEYSSDYFDGKDVYQVWDFGPALLDSDGEAYGEGEFDRYYKNIVGRNPRSSIGYYEPGHYVFIVADGRRNVIYEGEKHHSKGIRMHDLAEVYERLGVKVAYALDGGDSAFAYYDGEVIRQDYDRAHTEGEAPREIYDIIAIGEVLQ